MKNKKDDRKIEKLDMDKEGKWMSNCFSKKKTYVNKLLVKYFEIKNCTHMRPMVSQGKFNTE